MRVIPIALAAHYQLEVTTIAACMKVTRTDGVIHGFTDTDTDLVVSGITYKPGFSMSAMESTDDLAVGNMEFTILPNEAVYPVVDILAGKWKGAAFEIFEVNYLSISDGKDVRRAGTIGEVKKRVASYVVEFRGLTQSMQQTQGITAQMNCRARLGDAKCTLNLTPFTFTGTIDSSTDRRHFVDAARTEGDDYFAEGKVTITAAANSHLVGYSAKVKSNTGSAFLLSLPFPFGMTAGDSYTIVAGCRKRRDEDCIAKFNNILNFQAEPDAPGQDKVTSPGSAPVQPDTTPTVPTVSGPDMDGGE